MRISSLNNYPKTIQKQPSFGTIKSVELLQASQCNRMHKQDLNPNNKKMLIALQALQDSPAIQELKKSNNEYKLKLYSLDGYDESRVQEWESTIELKVMPLNPTDEDSYKTISASMYTNGDRLANKAACTKTFAKYMSNCRHIENGRTSIPRDYLNEPETETKPIKPQIDSIIESLID